MTGCNGLASEGFRDSVEPLLEASNVLPVVTQNSCREGLSCFSLPPLLFRKSY